MEQFEIIKRIDSSTSKTNLKEDLLNTSSASQAIRSEHWGFLLVFIANFIFTFNGFLTKVIQVLYPTIFDTNAFLFIRTIMVLSLTITFSCITKERILSYKEIEHKLAFFIRTSLQYFSVSFYTMSVWYLRVSTTQIITLLSPIIVMFLSVLILKETFYTRYIYGLVFCLGGSFIIVLNEKSANQGNADNTSGDIMSINTILGVMFGMFSNFTGAFISIANKVLATNRVPVNTQMCYLSLNTFICTLIGFVYTGYLKICFGYAILCFIHGAIFYLGQYLYNKGIQKIDLSKSTMITYFKIIWIFLLSGIFLGETIFLSDVLGAALIVSYLLYNVFNPIVKI